MDEKSVDKDTTGTEQPTHRPSKNRWRFKVMGVLLLIPILLVAFAFIWAKWSEHKIHSVCWDMETEKEAAVIEAKARSLGLELNSYETTREKTNAVNVDIGPTFVFHPMILMALFRIDSCWFEKVEGKITHWGTATHTVGFRPFWN